MMVMMTMLANINKQIGKPKVDRFSNKVFQKEHFYAVASRVVVNSHIYQTSFLLIAHYSYYHILNYLVLHALRLKWESCNAAN